MREILFRGKRSDNGNWIIGSLFTRINDCFIFPLPITTSKSKVDTETVGQFTGLTDKKGTKIFEGDIIRAKIEGGNHNGFTWHNMPVDFQQGSFCLNDRNGYIFCVLGAFAPSVTLEVIGNIHDNPELLEEGDS
jgi:uncharacterized phage protein (TIGR01671 family)